MKCSLGKFTEESRAFQKKAVPFWTASHYVLIFPKCLWIVMRGVWNIPFHLLKDSLLIISSALRNEGANPEAFTSFLTVLFCSKFCSRCLQELFLFKSCCTKEMLVEKAGRNDLIKVNTSFFLKWKGVTLALDLPLNPRNSLAPFWLTPSPQKNFQPCLSKHYIIKEMRTSEAGPNEFVQHGKHIARTCCAS